MSRFAFSLFCMCDIAIYEWDEAKRATNLEKHGLDFADAQLVYEFCSLHEA